MGLIDFIKGELIEIIEWTDDSRDTLSYRFPDEDKEIKRGAQLIVRESEVAQFVYLGQFGDSFGRTEVGLLNDPGFAVDAGAVDDVVIELVGLFLGHDGGHIG